MVLTEVVGIVARAQQRLRPAPRRVEHVLAHACVARRKLEDGLRHDVVHALGHVAARDAPKAVLGRLHRAQREQRGRRAQAHQAARARGRIRFKREPEVDHALHRRLLGLVEKVQRDHVLHLERVFRGIRLRKRLWRALDEHRHDVGRLARLWAHEARGARVPANVERRDERVVEERVGRREPQEEVDLHDIVDARGELLRVALRGHREARDLGARLHAVVHDLAVAVDGLEHKVEEQKLVEQRLRVELLLAPEAGREREDKVELVPGADRGGPHRRADRVRKRAPLEPRERLRERREVARQARVHGRVRAVDREARRRARGRERHNVRDVGGRLQRGGQRELHARKLEVLRAAGAGAHLQQVDVDILDERKLGRGARREHVCLRDFRGNFDMRKRGAERGGREPADVRHADEELDLEAAVDTALDAAVRPHVLLREKHDHVAVPVRRHRVERRRRARHARERAAHKVARGVEQRLGRARGRRARASAHARAGERRAERGRIVREVRTEARDRRVQLVDAREAARAVLAQLLELAGADREAGKLVDAERRLRLGGDRGLDVREVEHVHGVRRGVVVAQPRGPRRLCHVVRHRDQVDARRRQRDRVLRAAGGQDGHGHVGHVGDARRAVEAVARRRALAVVVVGAARARVQEVVGHARGGAAVEHGPEQPEVAPERARAHLCKVGLRRGDAHLERPQRAPAEDAHAARAHELRRVALDALEQRRARDAGRVVLRHDEVDKRPAQRLEHRDVGRGVLRGIVSGLARDDRRDLDAAQRAPEPVAVGRKVLLVAAAHVAEPRRRLRRELVLAVGVERARAQALLALVDPHELARRLDAVPVRRREHLAHLPTVVAPGREHGARGVQRGPVFGAPQAPLHAQLRARARLGRCGEGQRLVHVPRVQYAGRRARVARAIRVLAHEARLDRARARAPVAVGGVSVVARLAAALHRIVPARGGARGGAVVARLRAHQRAQQRRARQQREPGQLPAPTHAARARRGLIYPGVQACFGRQNMPVHFITTTETGHLS